MRWSFQEILLPENVKRILEVVEQKKSHVIKWKQKGNLHVGDRVSAGGGCGVTVIAKTRCGCAMFRECSKSVYDVL